MASENVDIKIRLRVQQLDRDLRRIEQRLEKIKQVDVKLRGQQRAAAETKKLAENVQKAFQGFSKLEKGLRSILAPIVLATGFFDKQLGSLNEELKVVSQLNKRLNLLADTTSNLDGRLRGVNRSWSKITYDIEVYNALAKKQVELEDRRSEILRRQAEAVRRQRLEQERLYDAVRRNVRQSESGRAGSGFADFSQGAGGAVRRRFETEAEAKKKAIQDVERLRETKALKSYNTRQRRIRYLNELQEGLDAKLEKSRDRRRQRRLRAEEDAIRKQARLRENLLLGAGFPLLFGGGAGAVGGGILGSLLGDGFGGQILLSALGTQLDQLSIFVQNLAGAFREGGDAAGFLEQSLGYLDPTTKTLISNLQQSGQTARAAAEAQRVLADEIGEAGANALRRAGEESDIYSRSLKQLALRFYGAALAASQFFQNLRGDYGRIPGTAAPVAEDETSRAAQNRIQGLREQNALLREQSALNGIDRQNNAEAYALQQRRVALQTYNNELAGIKRQLDEGSITLQERAELKEKAKLTYIRAQNGIARELAQAREREAAAVGRAAEADQRKYEASVKAGKRLLNNLELQVIRLSDVDRTELRIREARERSAQIQETINTLLDSEQRSIATALNQERERLAVQKAYEEGAKRIFKLNQQFYGKGRAAKLNELTTAGKAVIEIGEGIGSAFKTSFDSIADGTKSAQQIISDFFKSIGQALIDYATTAIAQYIAVGIARIFAGVGSASVAGTDWGSMDTSAFGGGFGVDTTGLMGPVKPFAQGGYVTRPTNAVVGEGGESEYVIPSSKMNAAMERWNAGARGSSVIEGGASGGGSGSSSAPIYNFQTTQFMDREWVDREQLVAAMNQAAKLGAQGGEQRTLRKLQMSAGTRRKVGI